MTNHSSYLLFAGAFALAAACSTPRPAGDTAHDPLPMCNPVQELLQNGGFEAAGLAGWVEHSGKGSIVTAKRASAGGPADRTLSPRTGGAAFSSSAQDGGRMDPSGREVVLSQALPIAKTGLLPGSLIAASIFVAGACTASGSSSSQLMIRFLRGGAHGELLDTIGGDPIAPPAGIWKQLTTPTAKVPAEADTIEVVYRSGVGVDHTSIEVWADDLSLAVCRPLGEPLAAWKAQPTAADATAGTNLGDGQAGGPGALGVPRRILNGNTNVSCTLDCGADRNCAAATVYVSACDADQPSRCYGITPADTEGGGNTYLVSLDAAGGASLVRGAMCAASQESTQRLPLDLLFVIDTTGSMSAAISGVVESIDTFINGLAEKGVDSRIGGIAFGDGAPLTGCRAPDAPYAPFTATFGAGTSGNPASFSYWLANLSASHCGDGGGDGPENALDALEFALGNAKSGGTREKPFEWRPGSLRVAVVITDVAQHQKSDKSNIAHFDLEEVVRDVMGVAVVHTVSPNFGCMNTPFEGCACNADPNKCDEGCACDARCPTAGCPADKAIGRCDSAMQTCDLDCPGYPARNFCDKRPGICDPESMSPKTPCANDFDCAGGARVNDARPRRCFPQDIGTYADVARLSLATGGAFTPLSPSGHVDLTALPLAGVITATEKCQAALPNTATKLRCVFLDGRGNQGEVVLDIGHGVQP